MTSEQAVSKAVAEGKLGELLAQRPDGVKLYRLFLGAAYMPIYYKMGLDGEPYSVREYSMSDTSRREAIRLMGFSPEDRVR